MGRGPVLRGLPRGVRIGLDRARESLGPIAWVSVCAAVAYATAGALLGHPFPFFAAVAAFSALGFSPDVQPRRVGEVALGISLGVGMGELVQHEFGSGPLQTLVVVFVAATIARVLDPSPVLTTQSAVQAIVVCGLPALATAGGGGIGRWTDALLGGLVALLFSLFIPKDPRRRPRALARSALVELAQVLALTGRGLSQGSADDVREALDRARATQRVLLAWEESVVASGTTARVSPAWRRHREEVADLADVLEYTDRAIRTTRVLQRRGVVAVLEGQRHEELGALVEEVGLAVHRLGAVIGTGEDRSLVAARLVEIAHGLGTNAERDPQRHTLLSLLRSLTFDLLRAAGLDEAAATAALRQRGRPPA